MTGTDEETFDDARLQTFLDEALVKDSEGNKPEDEDYEPTYDLHKAAAAIWRIRAAEVARYAFDTQIDMQASNRSTIFNNFHKMARYHDMKRMPSFGSPVRGESIVSEDNVSVDA